MQVEQKKKDLSRGKSPYDLLIHLAEFSLQLEKPHLRENIKALARVKNIRSCTAYRRLLRRHLKERKEEIKVLNHVLVILRKADGIWWARYSARELSRNP